MGKKILIVDDDPEIVKVILLNLKSKNYDCITASSGKEALEKIALEKPNLVYLDLNLADISGMEVARQIHSKTETANMPIIFLTAQADIESNEITQKHHVKVVMKPINFKELIQLTENLTS